jgi:putative transcription antitermination factor YqgF
MNEHFIKNKRIIALDVGRVRVGAACLEPGSLYVKGIGIFKRAGGEAEKALLKYIEENSINLVVVGMPLNAYNDMTEQSKDVLNFSRRLQVRCFKITERTGVPIVIEYEDEYLSSLEAAELKATISKKRPPGRYVDMEAAVIILKRFIKRVVL